MDVSAELRSKKDRIIDDWKKRVLNEIPQTRQINRSALIDSLPEFIDHLIERLAKGETNFSDEIQKLSQEHAEHRVEIGKHSLEDVLREYQILREIIFHVLEEGEQLTALNRDIILKSIDIGVTEVATEYLKLKSSTVQEKNAELQAEKEKFDSLFEKSPAAMALLRGPEFIFEKINKLYELLVGRSNIIGKKVLEVLPEVKDQPYMGILENVYKTGDPYVGKESQIVLKRGPEGHLEDRYVDFTYLRINDSKGNPYGIFAHAVDVTEKVVSRTKISEAYKTLRKTENELRSFIEAMPALAFVADADGKITYFNQRFYDYVGLGRETEGWGWKDQPVHHPDDLQKTIESWKHSIETGEPYEIEYRLRRYDGVYHWHLGRAVPLKDENGKVLRWLGTNTDIEDQKRAVSQLEQERAVREQFVATITHDLRNPLTAVKSSAQLMIRSPDKPEVRERAISRIISAVDRSDKMIRNMLDANLIQAGKPLPLQMDHCDMSVIAHEVVEEQKIIHGNRFVVNCKSPLVGHWSCDGINRIFDNLISNAVKYGDPEKEITLTCSDTGNEVEVLVHNFGDPITPEEQKTLFSAFKRTKSAQSSSLKGWGLGLTLVKGITEAHGGKVSIDSSREKGTTFKVVLPKGKK